MIQRLKTIEKHLVFPKPLPLSAFLRCFRGLLDLYATDYCQQFRGWGYAGYLYAAFRIPDLVFNLLVLGTLSVAFIPIFTELLITDKEKAYKIANSILNFLY